MPMTPSSIVAQRPTIDEWGLYDPQKAGLAAVYTRLSTVAAAVSSEAAAEPVRPRPHTDPPAPSGTTLR